MTWSLSSGLKRMAAAEAALGQVDELLTRRKARNEQEYRPQSLETAVNMLPEAEWVLISVAGRYAAGVAREAMRLDKNVFLFSDNVSVEEEISLKQKATEKGLLVMGPDCGTAIVRGVGLGFANKVRLGPIGMVAAAGTGLQQVSARIHQLGGGMTYGIGTGGRDLSEKVGAVTFRMGLEFLSRDPETKVIVLVSKPPSPRVAEEVLKAARKAGKPVVVEFVGRPGPVEPVGNLHFARSLDDAARMAVEIAEIARSILAPQTSSSTGLQPGSATCAVYSRAAPWRTKPNISWKITCPRFGQMPRCIKKTKSPIHWSARSTPSSTWVKMNLPWAGCTR